MTEPAARDEVMFDEIHRLVTSCLQGDATASDLESLQRLIDGNSEARRLYIEYLGDSIGLRCIAERPAAREAINLLDIASSSRPVSPPIPNFVGTAWHGTFSYFSDGWPLAYLIGALIVGVGLTVASLIMVTHHAEIAQDPSLSVPLQGKPSSEMTFVGHITGMVDVRWADEQTSAASDASVPLGRKYALASGFMEITYDTGAKVILQGPCTYEVNSAAGGFLAVGKLTARLEKGDGVRGTEDGMANLPSPASGRGAGGEGGLRRNTDGDRNQPQSAPTLALSGHRPQVGRENRLGKSPVPRLQPTVPLFTIKTPTATVTDLGTEFGVEVDKAGATTSHVFRGEIEVRLVGNRGDQAIRLGRNESAQVKTEGDQRPTVRRVAFKAEGFVRQMPKPQSLVLLSDAFDTRTNSAVYGETGEFGLNQELPQRQSGLYQRVRYRVGGDYADYLHGLQSDNVQVNHLRCPGKLCLMADYGRAGWVVLNRCFPRDMVVSAELVPEAVHWPDKSRPETYDLHHRSPNWIALGVRGRGVWFDRSLLPLATDAGAVLCMNSDGGWGYFENGKRIASGSVSAKTPYRVVMQVVGNKLKASINDIPLNLDPSHHQGVRTLRGMAVETSGNYISLGVSNAISVGGVNVDAAFDLDSRVLSTVDNLTVSTVGPEARDEIHDK